LTTGESGKGYRPSPRPSYEGPTVIRHGDAARHVWGDEEAGRVADLIYLSNLNLHTLVFELPPGGAFTHSDSYRTIFGADEVMVVLEGEFVLANPETGEVQRASRGEGIFFRKNTWHHGFNVGQSPVRVLEYFAPPPATGASGEYARTQPYLAKEKWHYGPFEEIPDRRAAPRGLPARRTLTKLGEADLELGLLGADRKALVGYFATTEYLRVGRLELNPGTHLTQHRHVGDELVYVDEGSLVVALHENATGQRFELGPRDGMYIPARVKHGYQNPNAERVLAYFGQAPTQTAGPSA